MLTTTQAATALRLTPGRVRQLIQAGALAATKAGRDWLLDPAVVAQYQPRGRGWPRGKPRKKPERTGEAPCPGL